MSGGTERRALILIVVRKSGEDGEIHVHCMVSS